MRSLSGYKTNRWEYELKQNVGSRQFGMAALCWDRNTLVQYNYSILVLRVGFMTNDFDRTVEGPLPRVIARQNILTAFAGFDYSLS